jgi:DNA-binding sugar fermentation-stimulating protein
MGLPHARTKTTTIQSTSTAIVAIAGLLLLKTRASSFLLPVARPTTPRVGRVTMVTTRRATRELSSAIAVASTTAKDSRRGDSKLKRSVSNTTTTATARAKKPAKAMPEPAMTLGTGDETPLLDLGPLEEGVLVCRPSERNKSPYVGDVRITSGPNSGSVAVTHIPNMDSGGKCRPGVRVLCRRQPGVGPNTVGGKFGMPKCELICQLVRCDEPENASLGGCWVSAHPSIGEKLVEALIRRGAFDDRLHAPVKELETQVSKARKVTVSESGGYRPDFRATHADGSSTLIETKQVVDTDYDPATVAAAANAQPGHPVYARRDNITPSTGGYERAGIFPWGKRGQKGPDAELVVSARAIEHVRELAEIVAGVRKERSGDAHTAVVLMAGRHDVAMIRPNGKACPSFAAHLSRAESSGVRILGHRVRWGEGEDVGKAFDGGAVLVLAPLTEDDLVVLVPKAKKEKETTPSPQKKAKKVEDGQRTRKRRGI